VKFSSAFLPGADDLAVFKLAAIGTILPFPCGVIGFLQGGLHIDLLFAPVPAELALHEIGGSKARGLIEPAGDNDAGRDRSGLACQDDKYGLGDFFRVMRIAGAAEGRRIDEIEIPGDQRRKGVFRLAARKFGEQLMVIRFRHPPYDVHEPRNGTKSFS
jgi:hypothetical protein